MDPEMKELYQVNGIGHILAKKNVLVDIYVYNVDCA